jgi:hypothetical protein
MREKDGLNPIWFTIKRGAKSFWSNLKWMLFTIIVPEYILGKAIGDFFEVWKMKKEVDELKKTGKVGACEEWGLSHGFFGLIGGFRVLDREVWRESLPDENTPSGEKHGDKQRSEDRQTSLQWNPPGFKYSRIYPPQRLIWLRKENKLSRLPNITKEEIHDKSKANFLVKALALVQAFWVCMQVIVRTARGLAISQLELQVTAFSACTIITYIFLIPKPQGVQVPMRPIPVPSEAPGYRYDPRADYWSSLRSLVIPGLDHGTDFHQDEEVTAVPNDGVPGTAEEQRFYALGMSVGGIIFGAIHVSGWNLQFPTPIEQVLWRIASLMVTCLLPVALLPYIAVTVLPTRNWVDFFGGLLLKIWGLVFGAIYVVARLFILVEAFRTLAFLPPNAFVATWVSNIPSVG